MNSIAFRTMASYSVSALFKKFIILHLLILKENTEAIQRKNRASYLKMDNLE